MIKFELNKLLSPKSIAVVGAAREPGKLGNIIVTNIQQGGFTGEIFPVNPNATEINNLPCFASYKDLPKAPDLAIIAVPADVALAIIPEIAGKGTKQLLILGAGFKEAGAEGVEKENKLIALAKKYSLTIIGPNCLGFVNNAVQLNATFGQANHTSGNARFISQSGAIATAMFDWAHSTGVGFSDFITLGNKAVLGENEVLEYWQEQSVRAGAGALGYDGEGLSDYRPIGLYLESITDGQKFVELAKKIGQKNPLFILKPGKSAEAKLAMQSHTGAMANDEAIFDEAMQEAGVLRCEGAEDFFDLARGFAWENAPKTPYLAVVSNAGGPAVLVTDSIKQEGLELAPLSPATHKILAENLPRAANIHNPVDVLGDALADRYRTAMSAVLAEPMVSALIVILTPQIMTQIENTAETIGALSKKYHKPILCSFMGGYAIKQGETVLNRYRIPSFRFPERAVKTLAQMYKWERWRMANGKYRNLEIKKFVTSKSAKLVEKILITAKNAGQKALSNFEAQEVIKAVGIKVPFIREVKNFGEAKSAARLCKYPVAAKISSAALVHKTEFGGVILNIKNDAELKKAFTILSAKIKKFKTKEGVGASIIIQKYIQSGTEVIIGCKRDPSFGGVIMFGAGGIMAELLGDKNIALLPLEIERAQKLIERSKIYPVLKGWRGAKALAIKPLAKLMVKLGHLFLANPEIAELEINPVMMTESDASAADARVILM